MDILSVKCSTNKFLKTSVLVASFLNIKSVIEEADGHQDDEHTGTPGDDDVDRGRGF